MAAILETSVEIGAPVETVFAYVEDAARLKDWVYGLHQVEPVSGPLRGEGATYDGMVRLGVPLRSTVRCTGYEPNRRVEISSIRGIQNTQRWTFNDLGHGRTRVEVWVSYTLPGGPAGAAIERAVRPLVGVAVKHSSEALVRNVEALGA